jgi:hypothetical protein
MNKNILKVVERYKVVFDHGPNDMYIEVYEHPNGFFAECNYSLLTKKRSSPYQHRHSDQSIERAVSFVASSITPDDNFELDDFCWVSEVNRNVAFLGTGEKIKANDFLKK